MLPPLLVIAGATATGKTSLALALAETLGDAEIVSADSRQVYRGMDIGTAKVTAEERQRIPHHGLDLVAPDEPFSVAAYVRHAREALEAIGGRAHLAILVGGTGLYLRAVAAGVPYDDRASDPALRAELEARLVSDGLRALTEELRLRAPTVAARTDTANPRRVVRALERARLVGDALPEPPRGYPAPVLWLGLEPARASHLRAIALRAEGQFRGGLLDEVTTLLRRYPIETRAFEAMGYREAMRLVRGEWTLDQALEETITRTRRYAKRQRTWFRAERAVEWLPAEEPFRRSLQLVRRFLEDAKR